MQDTLTVPAENNNGNTDQVFFGSKIKSDVEVGPLSLHDHMAYYPGYGNIPFGQLSPGSSGIIGNNLFIKQAIITLDPQQNQFVIALK